MPHRPTSRAKGFTPLKTIGQPEKRKRSLAGFTLIELIAVIAIVAVVSGLSLASFSTLTGDRLTADARKIVNDLCWARQLAVAKHRNHIVVFDTAAESYVVYDDLNGNALPEASEEIKKQILTAGIDLISVIPVPEQIAFSSPQGATQAKIIALSSQGKTKTVTTFANTGYVKLQ